MSFFSHNSVRVPVPVLALSKYGNALDVSQWVLMTMDIVYLQSLSAQTINNLTHSFMSGDGFAVDEIISHWP